MCSSRIFTRCIGRNRRMQRCIICGVVWRYTSHQHVTSIVALHAGAVANGLDDGPHTLAIPLLNRRRRKLQWAGGWDDDDDDDDDDDTTEFPNDMCTGYRCDGERDGPCDCDFGDCCGEKRSATSATPTKSTTAVAGTLHLGTSTKLWLFHWLVYNCMSFGSLCQTMRGTQHGRAHLMVICAE